MVGLLFKNEQKGTRKGSATVSVQSYDLGHPPPTPKASVAPPTLACGGEGVGGPKSYDRTVTLVLYKLRSLYEGTFHIFILIKLFVSVKVFKNAKMF